jgi:hypothetical protein
MGADVISSAANPAVEGDHGDQDEGEDHHHQGIDWPVHRFLDGRPSGKTFAETKAVGAPSESPGEAEWSASVIALLCGGDDWIECGEE